MKRVYVYLKIILVLAMIAVGAWYYGQLPEIVPIHWNFEGVADGFGGKTFSVVLFPIISLALLLLFWLLPKIDPKKEKYKKFEEAYEMIQLAILFFFAYIYIIALYAAMNPEVNVGQWIVSGVGLMFILIGNYMSKIRQNFFVGIKTPWTLASEEVWNKTHRLGAWCFVLAGLILLGMAIAGKILMELFILSIIIAALVPIVYSYIVFHSKAK